MIEGKEDAVSPVVGVMLMLVVTIIIAAVVSGFAGGLAGGTEKAPQASLDCKISENSMGGAFGYEFALKHLSGDPINTHDIKLITSWVDGSGTFHVQDTIAPIWLETEEVYFNNSESGTNSSHYKQTSLNTHYTLYNWTTYAVVGDVYYNAPYKIIPSDMPANSEGEEETLWFGNYILRAGDVAKAIMNIGPDNDATPIIADLDMLTGNEVINVKLIDMKSGSTIFNKDIVVGA